jgi:hypothetical protein
MWNTQDYAMSMCRLSTSHDDGHWWHDDSLPICLLKSQDDDNTPLCLLKNTRWHVDVSVDLTR